MKFTPEIIAALQTLKNAAESDFELHRISLLEKDLTAPPTVEVIDDSHQKFDGITYHKTKDGHYFYYQSIHRAIYAYYFGEVPQKNFDIHHVDENPDNNAIENLRLMTKSEHMKLHENAV